jgi:hypothetical protein
VSGKGNGRIGRQKSDTAGGRRFVAFAGCLIVVFLVVVVLLIALFASKNLKG